MPKKNEEENQIEKKGTVISQSITEEMRTAFLDYAMSVITDRALPDVRDGLKPVQRRILYTMHELGLNPGGKTRKSAKIIGDVTGNYHPHGDAAAYGALVTIIQEFSMRYPLAIGQGNFGSIDGDNAAAPRYTEAKMSKISIEMLRDIEKQTVDWQPNYEGTRKEPKVLPASVPNLLLNGTLGIAVGMATNIPPHNLREIIGATTHLIDNKDATTEDLLEFVKGPDFPTAGVIFDEKAIAHAYATGRGGIVTRGVAEIVEGSKGQTQIIIQSLPYRVNKANLMEKIADLVRNKKLEGVKGLRDESSKDIRVVIDLKGGSHPQKVLNYIYKHTQLEETFHVNLVTLVKGVPQTMALKGVLEEFITHRLEVVTRRTQFDLDKAEAREHILLGLKKALDHIDEIIKLIKASKDAPTAHANLMKKFKFSELQATAILEMRLQKLAGLERKKIEDELKEIQKLIKELQAILKSEAKKRTIIKTELTEIADKHGDDRKTKVMKGGVKVISVEDLIPDEENAVVLTAGGYIKRTNPNEFKRQKRGGVGVVDLKAKDEDFVTDFFVASTHSDLLFFTDRGKAYQVKMYDLPEGKRATKGKSVMNFLPFEEGERITSILPMPKEVRKSDASIMMVTRQGVAKKVEAKSFHDVRSNGIIAIKLKAGDELEAARFVEKGDEMIVVTKEGQAIRFKESDIRVMGRSAGGVKGMSLKKGDEVINAHEIKKEYEKPMLLTLSENGYGKQTGIDEYKVQKRGGSGIKTAKVTDKTGKLMASRLVTDQEEVVAMSKKSQVIRIGVNEVPELGRQTQGVRVMKLRAADKLASMFCL